MSAYFGFLVIAVVAAIMWRSGRKLLRESNILYKTIGGLLLSCAIIMVFFATISALSVAGLISS
jgi:tetrahydromethanopterin S-methyltransferase subunit G